MAFIIFCRIFFIVACPVILAHATTREIAVAVVALCIKIGRYTLQVQYHVSVVKLQVVYRYFSKSTAMAGEPLCDCQPTAHSCWRL